MAIHSRLSNSSFCRSSGPVSYGYSELENNNQVSLTSSMVGDISLQTPNVEYSSTSIKKEFAVWLYFSFYFVQQLPILQIANKYNILWAHINLQYLQSPVDGGQTMSGKVITRRKMEDKGQVTDDIAAAHATSTESPSSNSVDAQSSNNGTSICQDVLTMHDTSFQSTFYLFSELLFFCFSV